MSELSSPLASTCSRAGGEQVRERGQPGTLDQKTTRQNVQSLTPLLAVVLAVNKCENAAKADLQAAEFWGSGLEPIPVSAISGSGGC